MASSGRCSSKILGDLSKAVVSNKFQIVINILKKKPKIINKKNVDKILKLVNNSRMMNIILRFCGHEIDHFYTNNSYSLLLSALEKQKNFKMIKVILSYGKDIVNKGSPKWSPLGLAIHENIIIIAKLLISHNANVNAPFGPDAASPLHHSTSLEGIKLLIENGADVNSTNRYGYTPLINMILMGKEKEFLFELIESGADVNIRDETGKNSLHHALFEKCDETVIWNIVNRCDNVNAEDNKGRMPLCFALNEIKNKDLTYRKDFICELIKKGFLVSDKVFMYALKYCRNLCLLKEFVKSHGVNVKYVDNKGNCVLHKVHDENLISCLMRKGAPINHKNNKRRTPLLQAIYKNEFFKILFLLVWGAVVEPEDYNIELIYTLLSASCDVLNLLIVFGSHVCEEIAKHLFCFRNINVINEAVFYVKDYRRIDITKGIHNFLKHMVLIQEGKCSKGYLSNYPVFESLIKVLSKQIEVDLQKMKKIKIIDNLSFYDFLFKCNLTNYCTDLSNCEFIKNDFEQVRKTFPVLYSHIIVRIHIRWKIVDRFKSLKKFRSIVVGAYVHSNEDINVTQSFANGKSTNDSVDLGFDCLYMVGHFLNDQEINCLIAASILEPP